MRIFCDVIKINSMCYNLCRRLEFAFCMDKAEMEEAAGARNQILANTACSEK